MSIWRPHVHRFRLYIEKSRKLAENTYCNRCAKLTWIITEYLYLYLYLPLLCLLPWVVCCVKVIKCGKVVTMQDAGIFKGRARINMGRTVSQWINAGAAKASGMPHPALRRKSSPLRQSHAKPSRGPNDSCIGIRFAEIRFLKRSRKYSIIECYCVSSRVTSSVQPILHRHLTLSRVLQNRQRLKRRLQL